MQNRIRSKSRKPKTPPKYWREKNRINTFKAPKPPLFRRILRAVFNPLTIGVFLLALLGIFLTATYFWFEYSDRIDLLLKGEVFTNTAGIYSAPKTLKNGETISAENLTVYLKSAGYIEKNDQADPSRSRYQIKENEIDIEPGNTGMIDGKKVFPALIVNFKKDGKAVASITDADAGKTVETRKARAENPEFHRGGRRRAQKSRNF